MGINYLLDTNTVIDFINGLLPANAATLIASQQPVISFVTRIELLAWSKLTQQEEAVLKKFISLSIVTNIEEDILLKTIEIKKSKKIKLPDAIIAATAIVKNLTILSRNLSDFNNIPNLNIIDPHALQSFR